MDIKNIIIGCKKGGRKAQKELFKKFAPYVYTICRRYAGNDEDAKEFMQDCFIRIYKKIELFDAEKGNLKNWIAKLSSNESINKLKAKSNILPITNIDLTERQIAYSTSNDDEYYSKEKIMLKAIQKLPEGYRNVLNLYVFERKSHKEIGAMLGITDSSSRSQLTRAKAQLKTLIQNSKITSYGT